MFPPVYNQDEAQSQRERGGVRRETATRRQPDGQTGHRGREKWGLTERDMHTARQERNTGKERNIERKERNIGNEVERQSGRNRVKDTAQKVAVTSGGKSTHIL